MKRLNKIGWIILLTVSLFPIQSWAQESSDQEDREENESRTVRKKGTRNYFNVEFGLANYLKGNGQFPDATNEIYTLKPLGSTSVGFTALNKTQLGGPLFLDWGLNVTWYSLKFEDPMTRLRKETDGIVIFADDNSFEDYRKSKLKYTYINALLIPMIHTDPSSKNGGFRFGAGIYGGYRIGSKLKVVFDEDGKQKDKIKSNFFLNNVRYGIRGQVGWKGTDLFFTYDMSTLFQEGRGPELNPFGFGIIF